MFFFYSYTSLLEYKELRLKEITKEIKAEVEYVNKNISGIEHTVKNIASSAALVYAEKDRVPVEKLKKYFEKILLDSQYLSDMSGGFGIWFEPYVFDSKSKNFAVFVYKNLISDKVEVEWLYDKDYHNFTWYRHLLSEESPRDDIYNRKKVFWSMPFILDLENEKRAITNVGAYIYNEEGNVIGIATIGWQMSDFVRTLEHINISPNSKILLADIKYNQIITYTFDHALKPGEQLSKIPWFSKIASDLPKLGQVNIGKINIDNKEYYIFTTMTDNEMLLASIVPVDELFGQINEKTMSTILLLTIFSIIIIIFTLYHVNRMLNKPIKKISSTVEQLNKEFDPEFEIEETDASDEISSITGSFLKVIRHNSMTLKSILDGVNSMAYIIDTRSYKLNYVNKAMLRYYKNIPKNAICYEGFLNRTEPCPFCPLLLKKQLGKESSQSETGDYFQKRTYRLHAAIIEWNGSKNHALLSVSNITNEVAEKEHLAALAETDQLTEVLNRRGAIVALERIVTLQKGMDISIAILDINGLKKVNDSLGHSEGDFYITALVQAIRNNIRTNDLIGRLGGDEFLIILPNCNTEIADKILLRIGEDLSTILMQASKTYEGSFSYGIETFVASNEIDIAKIMDNSDKKMYQAKRKYYKDKTDAS